MNEQYSRLMYSISLRELVYKFIDKFIVMHLELYVGIILYYIILYYYIILLNNYISLLLLLLLLS